MKITPHTSSTLSLLQKNNKDSKNNIQNSKKDIQDSLVLSNHTSAASIKEANNKIGALQTLNKSLDKLDINTKQLLDNISNKDTKKEIQKTITHSNFKGKNVFDEDFKKISKNIKLDSQLLKKQATNLNTIEDIHKFNQTIKTQKNFTNQAITILQNHLNKTLNTDDKNYNQLNTQLLKSPSFSNAHKLDALSLDKVFKLLA